MSTHVSIDVYEDNSGTVYLWDPQTGRGHADVERTGSTVWADAPALLAGEDGDWTTPRISCIESGMRYVGSWAPAQPGMIGGLVYTGAPIGHAARRYLALGESD